MSCNGFCTALRQGAASVTTVGLGMANALGPPDLLRVPVRLRQAATAMPGRSGTPLDSMPGDGVVAIEWAERWRGRPDDVIEVRLETVDEDTWHPHLYDISNPEVSDQWGTANEMDDFITREMFNDPDTDSLFVAPPV